MTFDQTVESRRTIRRYVPGVEIPRADMEAMVRAAQLAPSWKNSQTARYYVALTPGARQAVLENCLPKRNADRCADAAAFVLAAFKKGVSGHDDRQNAVNECGEGWGFYDLGLANANLILKARDLGYDTLIMGLRDGAALRTQFGVPETEEVVAVIAVGKRAEDPKMPARKPMDEILRFF